jgi:hypothetical protein
MIPIIIGVAEVALSVLVQSITVILALGWLRRRRGKNPADTSLAAEGWLLARVMVILFLGHLAQAALWAIPFRFFGEFADFETAFYHSAVNYASLGYGDIVMSERWRLLGALEAANGVLMFGVSTALFFSLMSELASHRHSRRN